MSHSQYSDLVELLAQTNHLFDGGASIFSLDARLKVLFYHTHLSIQIVDSKGKTILVNPTWRKLWGLLDDDQLNNFLQSYNLLEDPLLESYGLLNQLKKAFAGEMIELPELSYDQGQTGPISNPRYIKTYVHPLKDKNGVVQGVILIHSDVTENRSLAVKQRFLGNLASILLESLDFEKTLEHFSQVVIPFFCDACLIDIYQDGEIKSILIKHFDPEIEKVMAKVHLNFLNKKSSSMPTYIVLEKGTPHFEEQTSIEYAKSLCDEDIKFEDIQFYDFQSYIGIPLKIRGETIGVISFLLGGDRRRFTHDDLNLAIEVGWLVSLAIDNAKLYQEARQAITLREDFISIASHELKTPLTSIKLQLDVLNELIKDFGAGPEYNQLNKVAKISNKHIDRLTNLIDAMLDMTRLSKSNFNLSMQRIDLTLLVQEVISRFSDQLNLEKIICNFEYQDANWVLCDPLRIEQVISNLISNAIRYGKKTPINIRLAKKDEKIILTVKDRGIGIKPGDHLKIFERFQRGKNVNFTSGLGLGLYIVKEIVDAHAGRIWVESEVGKETTFCVELRMV